jgi:ATP-dependent protease HslVU (ClpYQ) peptidase subunit
MTAVVGLKYNDEILIGADSAGIGSNYSLTIRKDEKVFFVGKFLIGIAGSFRMGNLLRYYLPPLSQHQDMDDVTFMNIDFIETVREIFKNGGYIKSSGGREFGGGFLVGYRKNLYHIDTDLQVGISHDSYDAIGCGADLCLGSMYSTSRLPPLKRIQTALEAAQRHNGGVRGPFLIRNTIELEEEEIPEEELLIPSKPIPPQNKIIKESEQRKLPKKDKK